ncbi:MAG: hypothetical protein DMG53_17805 [Acidobacteria bacterium]|nr:MAG: hypothetical protein DMG53_17805 [Acidobacteriota bacterium]
MGKTGQKILRARDRVLEILQTENACSAWFREKDSHPADTFRTLSFEVDRHGEEFVQESTDPVDNATIFRNPYVAKVFQGDGRYATITINTNGAFFYPMSVVVQVWKEGVVVSHRGPRPTNVGPYPGDTRKAQVLVLLHEFGHVLDLLPADGNNVEGKSVENTNEVLRFCRAEIESKAKRGALWSSARGTLGRVVLPPCQCCLPGAPPFPSFEFRPSPASRRRRAAGPRNNVAGIGR